MPACPWPFPAPSTPRPEKVAQLLTQWRYGSWTAVRKQTRFYCVPSCQKNSAHRRFPSPGREQTRMIISRCVNRLFAFLFVAGVEAMKRSFRRQIRAMLLFGFVYFTPSHTHTDWLWCTEKALCLSATFLLLTNENQISSQHKSTVSD